MEAREEVFEAAEVVCSARIVDLYAMQELVIIGQSMDGGGHAEDVLEEGRSGC